MTDLSPGSSVIARLAPPIAQLPDPQATPCALQAHQPCIASTLAVLELLLVLVPCAPELAGVIFGIAKMVFQFTWECAGRRGSQVSGRASAQM